MKRYILYTIVMVIACLQASVQASINYTYDNLNRLKEVRYDNGVTVTYIYDALGNRTKKTVTGSHGPKEAYVWLSSNGKTLTFCYDSERVERVGTTFDLVTQEYVSPDWSPEYNEVSNVTTVVINPSFTDARPIYTSYWFFNMAHVEEIDGLEYLNTSEVKSMYNMFSGCSALTTLDLSHFVTSKVTDMNQMFYDCSSLKRLDLSHFDFSNVSNMGFLFNGCSSLESIIFGNVNSSNVQQTHYMFAQCSNLKRLDLSHFDFSKVDGSYYMLLDCNSLDSLAIPSSMSQIENNACSGIGSDMDPCTIFAPADFDFGVDTSGDYFVWKRGCFKLGFSARGDVDSDGRVNIDDLTALINYLLSGDASAINLNNADCYSDGKLNIDDVTALINYLLSGQW